jgi:cation diffusion facilitator family transporter
MVVAVLTGSGAILLDAAFNLCFFATALFTLRIARLLRRPDDRAYPFGYLQFEPLIGLVKGLLIIGVGILALADSARAILGGGTEVSAGLALAYAAYSTLHCALVAWLLRRANRRTPSPLIAGDIDNWMVNLAISLGMLVAFCLALLLQRAGMEAAARYVDPALVSLVVLLTVGVPLRMSGSAVLALLQRSPDVAVVSDIERRAGQGLGELRPDRLVVRVVKPGRTTYALIHVQVGERDLAMDVAGSDQLRRAIVGAVAAAHAPAIVDVVFTGIPEFVAPTTGFAPVE